MSVCDRVARDLDGVGTDSAGSAGNDDSSTHTLQYGVHVLHVADALQTRSPVKCVALGEAVYATSSLLFPVPSSIALAVTKRRGNKTCACPQPFRRRGMAVLPPCLEI